MLGPHKHMQDAPDRHMHHCRAAATVMRYVSKVGPEVGVWLWAQALLQGMPMAHSGSLMDDFCTDPSIGGPETPDRNDYHDNSDDDDEDELQVDDSDFLNFSFKNLELLGERNKEMVERMAQLRAEVGDVDPYAHGWLPSTSNVSATSPSASSSSTRR